MSLMAVLPPGHTTALQGTATAHLGQNAGFVTAAPTLTPLQSVLKAPSWKNAVVCSQLSHSIVFLSR